MPLIRLRHLLPHKSVGEKALDVEVCRESRREDLFRERHDGESRLGEIACATFPSSAFSPRAFRGEKVAKPDEGCDAIDNTKVPAAGEVQRCRDMCEDEMPMHIRVGTSGYSYKEWKGTFYPDDLPRRRCCLTTAPASIRRDQQHLLPDAGREDGGEVGEQVPDGFTFVLKAPQRITHQKRLVGAGTISGNCSKREKCSDRSSVRFSFSFRRFRGRMRSSCASRGHPAAERRVAFEFRHDSWFDEKIYGILAERTSPSAAADTEK